MFVQELKDVSWTVVLLSVSCIEWLDNFYQRHEFDLNLITNEGIVKALWKEFDEESEVSMVTISTGLTLTGGLY